MKAIALLLLAMFTDAIDSQVKRVTMEHASLRRAEEATGLLPSPFAHAIGIADGRQSNWEGVSIIFLGRYQECSVTWEERAEQMLWIIGHLDWF